MSHIEAIYRHGVFEPLGSVNLREDQHVRLSFEPCGSVALRSWLNEVQTLQAQIARNNSSLPDSASDIAADRLR